MKIYSEGYHKYLEQNYSLNTPFEKKAKNNVDLRATLRIF